MTETEAAWLAGIIEGEGCFYRMSKYSCRLSIEMSDSDVVAKAKMIMGLTNGTYVRDRSNNQGGRYRITYTIYTGNRAKLREVVAAVWPWLGRRRKAKCRELGIAPE